MFLVLHEIRRISSAFKPEAAWFLRLRRKRGPQKGLVSFQNSLCEAACERSGIANPSFQAQSERNATDSLHKQPNTQKNSEHGDNHRRIHQRIDEANDHHDAEKAR